MAEPATAAAAPAAVFKNCRRVGKGFRFLEGVAVSFSSSCCMVLPGESAAKPANGWTALPLRRLRCQTQSPVRPPRKFCARCFGEKWIYGMVVVPKAARFEPCGRYDLDCYYPTEAPIWRLPLSIPQPGNA